MNLRVTSTSVSESQFRQKFDNVMVQLIKRLLFQYRRREQHYANYKKEKDKPYRKRKKEHKPKLLQDKMVEWKLGREDGLKLC